jgi:hypothetical protein
MERRNPANEPHNNNNNNNNQLRPTIMSSELLVQEEEDEVANEVKNTLSVLSSEIFWGKSEKHS